MAYIDASFYRDEFKGAEIPADQIERLIDVASDVIDSLVSTPIILNDLNDTTLSALKKATAYQAEHLYAQGGIDAINGFAAGSIASESLGSYSVTSGGAGNKAASPSKNGVPVSPMAYSLLKRAGFISRWLYAGTRWDNG